MHLFRIGCICGFGMLGILLIVIADGTGKHCMRESIPEKQLKCQQDMNAQQHITWMLAILSFALCVMCITSASFQPSIAQQGVNLIV